MSHRKIMGIRDQMKVSCILCDSINILCVDNICADQIVHLYKITFGKNIAKEFDNISSVGYFQCLDCALYFFYPTVSGSEEFYNHMNKSENYYLSEKKEYEFASRFVDSSHDLLEIGCGRGAFSRLITAKSYTGLEFSTDAISLAKREGLEIIRDDILHYSQTHKESFDVVCFFQVLEHVSDPRSFIKSAISCLKDNGLMIASVPNNDTYLSMIPNSLYNLPPHHLTRWPVNAVVSIADIFCLELVALDFELLSDLHLRSFSNAIALKMLSPLSRQNALVDLSVISRIHRRIAYRVISPIISYIFRDNRIRPRGHTVTAVFRKR